MSGAVVNMVAKKVVGKKIKNYFSAEDLYFKPDEDRGRITGRKRKTSPKNFPIPEGLTAEETKFLQKMKKRAYRLDASYGTIPLLNTKLGFSALIGLIPGLGDVADTAFAILVYHQIKQIKPPLTPELERAMLVRVFLQAGIGAIPLLGDYVDGWYKANSRNVAALERELIRRRDVRRSRAGGQRIDHNYEGRRPEQYQHDLRRPGPPGYDDMDYSAQHAPVRHQRRIEQEPESNNPRRRWWSSQRDDNQDDAPPRLPPRDQPEMRHAGRYR